MESPAIQLVDVSTAVARKAGKLRVRQGMKTRDAVHLATAIVGRVDVLVVRGGQFPCGLYEGVSVAGPFDLDADKLV